MFQTCNNFDSDSNSNSIFFFKLYMSFNFHSLQLSKSPELLLSGIITLLALWADQSVTKSRTVRTKYGGRFHQNYGRFSLDQKFKFEK